LLRRRALLEAGNRRVIEVTEWSILGRINPERLEKIEMRPESREGSHLFGKMERCG
jgi:hypothetical protein